MNGTLEQMSSSSSSSSAALTVQADAAIADYSHSIGGTLAIVPSDGRRDAPGLDGHRATELPRDEAAA